MTDQAVHVFLFGKVEVVVPPAVTGMAGGAGSPVSDNADAKVVDLVAFPNQDVLAVANGIPADPGPVSGFHHLFSTVRMTLETGPCDILWGQDRIPEIGTVIQMWNQAAFQGIDWHRHYAVINRAMIAGRHHIQ